MKRDTFKTLAGLLVIAVIVVATFLYGNAQRQAQLKHDQTAKNQETANTSMSPTPTVASSTPSVNASATKTPASNTAPVASPTSNSLQGGKAATPTPSAKPTPTPSSSPVVAAATQPQTGGTTPLPQTGPSLGDLTGVAAVIFAIVFLRYSKRSVIIAARNRR